MGHLWLAGFAVASLAVSCVIFARRALRQRRGEEIHTAEAGYSVLTWRTNLPVALCEQIIVPLALAAVGWLIAHTFSLELGWWLMVCAASWLVMARWELRRRLSQTRATVDDMIRAKTFEARLDGHERQARTASRGPDLAGGYGRSSEPDMAELGYADTRPMRGEPPVADDSAAWSAPTAAQGVSRLLGWARRGRARN
jgi:hypothetical protein